MRVVGVDGCPDGWVSASVVLPGETLCLDVYTSFAELVTAFEGAAAIAVDIPIGLPKCYSRMADKQARKLMPGKGSSVFPAPHPDIIHLTEYVQASQKSKDVHKKEISRQGFGILPKVAEVNDFLTPELQARIFEVHPEVSFTALNEGVPVKAKKSTTGGFNERRELLIARSGFSPIPTKAEVKAHLPGINVNADDVLDAIVAMWSAKRFVEGIASRIPVEPEFDRRGLRAEIVY